MGENGNIVEYYSVENFAICMGKGSVFFTQGDYTMADYSFREARDISIQIHDEFSCERALAHFDYGLNLLCRVPLPQNDPMDFLPKEVDYYQSEKKPIPSFRLGIYTGTMGDGHRKILEDAKEELDLAWSIMKYKSEDYNLGKAYILSALGEAAFRKGEPNPEYYYMEASSIFKSLYGEQIKRVADIVNILASEFRNAKLLICFEGIARSKAIEYGAKAFFFYETIGRRLLCSIPSSSTPAAPSPTAKKRRGTSLVTQNDPFLEIKRKLVNDLLSIARKLKDKLNLLEKAIPAGNRHARGGVQINTNLEL